MRALFKISIICADCGTKSEHDFEEGQQFFEIPLWWHPIKEGQVCAGCKVERENGGHER